MVDIALECKPDEALMKSLGFIRKQITHQPNKGQVFRYMQKNIGAIAVVDEDPGSANPTFFSTFKLIGSQFDIEYYLNEKSDNKLIVIKPRLEEWILKQAKNMNFELANYSLPNTGHELHKTINSQLNKFDKLLADMIEAESAALMYLKSLITKK